MTSSTSAVAMPRVAAPPPKEPLDPAFERDAWTAVEARDRARDGAFVYAVATTGVYCRPSCPARRPLRANVRFFRAPDEAERAGFRACRRCRPRAATATLAEARVVRAREYLDAHPDEPVSLEALARRVGLSPYHLQRTFTRAFGLSPKRYQTARRLDRFRAAAAASDSVLDATFAAGFGSSRALYDHARHGGLGMTPAAYRRGGRGERVAFTLVDSPHGRLLVAATARGVCAVALGRDDAGLTAGLTREFPAAELVRDDAALRAQVEPIVAHLRGALPGLRVALDLSAGTAFQRRVWAALQAIPYGETRTYAQLAAALGCPTAARAVARACATNPIAVAVPCHRVVRTDGALGGYRWGLARKRALLAAERERAR